MSFYATFLWIKFIKQNYLFQFMKLLVVTLRPLNTRKFAKNATFHSSKFLKLKLSSHAIILCNFFLLNYTIFNCIKVICPRFSHILQFSVFLVLSVNFFLYAGATCSVLIVIVYSNCMFCNSVKYRYWTEHGQYYFTWTTEGVRC